MFQKWPPIPLRRMQHSNWRWQYTQHPKQIDVVRNQRETNTQQVRAGLKTSMRERRVPYTFFSIMLVFKSFVSGSTLGWTFNGSPSEPLHEQMMGEIWEHLGWNLRGSPSEPQHASLMLSTFGDDSRREGDRTREREGEGERTHTCSLSLSLFLSLSFSSLSLSFSSSNQ